MKLAIRIFAFTVAMAGLTMASMSSTTHRAVVSSQAAHAGLPVPTCGPGMGCPGTPSLEK